MKYDVKTVLKILFPEYQIIEAVRRDGFIAKKTNGQNQAVQQRQVQMPGGQIAMAGGMTIPAGASQIKQKLSETAIFSREGAVEKDTHSIRDDFEDIRRELSNHIIGQTNYLDQLCTAFKRPFLTGVDTRRPKNIIFILGGKGSCRHSSIKLIISAMKQRRLIGYKKISNINLALYPAVTDEDLFLTDLYDALYGQSDIVVFDNFEKCHGSIIDVVSTLAIHGEYMLDSRYARQNDGLIETTGRLVRNSTGEINANEKYFVFVSDGTPEAASDVFGSKFMAAVGDIIQTESYSEVELKAICRKLLVEFAQKCHDHFSYRVRIDGSIIDECADAYRKSQGVFSIRDYIENELFKPLAEYSLQHETDSDTQVSLDIDQRGMVAAFGDAAVVLSEYARKKADLDLEMVRKEMDTIIGLEKVKQYIWGLEDNYKVQAMRQEAGFKGSGIAMHMIFSGNPGTGKTTMARIVAKYLKALGILSVGQLREVSRADLVGQYVGHTARLTQDVIRSALGGVLFIDEAYSLCRNKNDAFGLEAIDALVKGMEDNRDDLVVILAGYSDEMEDFLETNPGLKSRFPNHIEFEDYTASEMYQISRLIASSKGYRIAEDCFDGLLRLFEKSQIKGKNDSGNGRLVRNVIESAILNQSKRLLKDGAADMDLLVVEDFKFETFEDFDLEESLEKIVGLESVKNVIRNQQTLLLANEKRRKAGVTVDTSQSLNMIFSGNPGTGKTTMARVFASMFKGMGLLKSGHLVEADRTDLVGEHVGETAQKTEKLFRSALGGVLFIDEAYALSRDGDSFGREAIDTLVKLIEDYRGEIVVILAGYKKEMAEFMKANSGLLSRFPLDIEFPDYTQDELYWIALLMIEGKGFTIVEEAKKVLNEHIGRLYKRASADSGNGRMVRNLVETILRNQSARIATSDITDIEELTHIVGQDITPVGDTKPAFDLEAELKGIIGLDEVKTYLRSLHARLRIQHERQKMGLSADDAQTLHMIFKGNPGTGKTMIARTVARLLYNMDIIQSDKLVETDRAGLVAGYVGQTAIKTTEKVKEAMDGVLFIDEAYSLSQGGANDFGREAIDTLVKLMDDHRERLVVILAGYSHEMEQFLSVNPGLKSRFPNVIEFADYSATQLLAMAENMYTGKGYRLTEQAGSKLLDILQAASAETSFGNGRYVRNVLERSVNKQALRLSTDLDLTREEITTIEEVDIERL